MLPLLCFLQVVDFQLFFYVWSPFLSCRPLRRAALSWWETAASRRRPQQSLRVSHGPKLASWETRGPSRDHQSRVIVSHSCGRPHLRSCRGRWGPSLPLAAWFPGCRGCWGPSLPLAAWFPGCQGRWGPSLPLAAWFPGCQGHWCPSVPLAAGFRAVPVSGLLWVKQPTATLQKMCIFALC